MSSDNMKNIVLDTVNGHLALNQRIKSEIIGELESILFVKIFARGPMLCMRMLPQ